ncbi:hypothetical protein CB0940_04396 [Cercospora beticola]|uniref:2EXR domain-containing protein n=1 Tax=Cercospora beticola TaxID=122368 RepID=A0A2G5HJ55_CERBT|nr:hypothetical protein CB0940_04396 [Cercospora beticola]PIA92591.1 hypothetical protein CB0940_04396 [Cercospora beticola]WPB01634.1 hypothetical protein RHO25_006264 [Cercospora beticola]CAK1363560.1 unnamed protein product [Cercospora beticola]
MDDWPFRKLAAELRNKIWELVLIHEDPIFVRSSVEPPGSRTKPEHLTALLQVCKESKNECSEMFYASNTFILESFSGASSLDEDLRRFIHKLGNNVPLVKRVIISAGTIDVLHRDSSCFYRICYGELDLLGHWRSRLSSLRFEVRFTKKHSVERNTVWDNGGLLLDIDVFDLPTSFRQAMAKISTAMGGKTVNLLAMESKIHLPQYDELCARQEVLGEATQASGPDLSLQSGVTGRKRHFTTALSTNPMEESRLGKLAPELRNRIWESAVTQDVLIRLSTLIRPNCISYLWRRPDVSWVFKTCKQIHVECADMFYDNNTFHVDANTFGTCTDNPLTMLATRDGPKTKNLTMRGFDDFPLPVGSSLHDNLAYGQMIAEAIQELEPEKLLALAPNLRHLSWQVTIYKGVTLDVDLRHYRESLRMNVAKAREVVADWKQTGDRYVARHIEQALQPIYAL